jgi:hypothetical protein
VRKTDISEITALGGECAILLPPASEMHALIVTMGRHDPEDDWLGKKRKASSAGMVARSLWRSFRVSDVSKVAPFHRPDCRIDPASLMRAAGYI